MKYLDFVRSLDCSRCLAPGPVEAHHIKGIGHFSGVGMKAPDILTMGLCGPCHAEMHRNPEMWPRQWEYIVRTIARAEKEGLIRAG